MSEITSRLATALADRYRIERHPGEAAWRRRLPTQPAGNSRKIAAPRLQECIKANRKV